MGIWIKKKRQAFRPGPGTRGPLAIDAFANRGGFSLSGHRLPSLYREMILADEG